jgi:hypothetical protein
MGVHQLRAWLGYVRSLQQEGKGVTFFKAVREFGYLHGKRRANLMDNQWRSYGVREEHRISISMMEEIYSVTPGPDVGLVEA